MNLYEILVPTQYGDTKKPISTRHHREWDKLVRKITGGLTLMPVAKGQWISHQDKSVISERVIPVRIACNEKQIDKIITLTLSHYRQQAVMAYKLSSEVLIKYSS